MSSIAPKDLSHFIDDAESLPTCRNSIKHGSSIFRETCYKILTGLFLLRVNDQWLIEWPLKTIEDWIDDVELIITPRLYEILSSGRPPTIKELQSLPLAMLSTNAGVYGRVITPEELGHSNHLYIGGAAGTGGTSSINTGGMKSRVKTHENLKTIQNTNSVHYNLLTQTYPKRHVKSVILAEIVIDWNTASIEEMWEAKLLSYLTEAVLTSWLWAYNFSPATQNWADLCPFALDEVDWLGTCSHCPLNDGIRGGPTKARRRAIKSDKQRERTAARRANMTPLEIENELKTHRDATAACRSRYTPEMIEKERKADRELKARKRAEIKNSNDPVLIEEARLKQNAANRKSKKKIKDNETPEERKVRCAKRQATRGCRSNKSTFSTSGSSSASASVTSSKTAVASSSYSIFTKPSTIEPLSESISLKNSQTTITNWMNKAQSKH